MSRCFRIFVVLGILAMPVFPGFATARATTPENGRPGSWQNSALVETVYGRVKGRAADANGWTWKGIPYAKPPVGPLRWKEPVEPEAWTNIRKAVRFGNSASQMVPRVGAIGSEDCLYLNIWRPKSMETGLPVYVFIHGGGNSVGSGSFGDYHGDAFSRQTNTVYVTLNYRLGVMGWFRHPAITGSGTSADRSGNFGTLDLIMALRWIRSNIAAFGGDPGNVTIAGESGGAFNVLSLLTSPPAAGLFHRAVAESGLSLFYSTAQAEEQAASLVEALLLADGRAADTVGAKELAARMNSDELDAYLRSKSPAELMRGIPTLFGVMAQWYSLYGDGYVLPEKGYDVFSSGGWANQVPLLIGVNREEMKLFRYLLKEPPPGSEDYRLLSEYQSLLWRYSGLDRFASAIASHQKAPPVYAYRFDWGSVDANGESVLPRRMGEVIGASHYAEVPFFLARTRNQLSLMTGNTYSRKNKPGRDKLRQLCVDYLGNYARFGNPNGAGLPTWEPWNPAPGAHKLLLLDAGYTGLKVSGSSEELTFDSVREFIFNDIQRRNKTALLEQLKGPIPMGLGK